MHVKFESVWLGGASGGGFALRELLVVVVAMSCLGLVLLPAIAAEEGRSMAITIDLRVLAIEAPEEGRFLRFRAFAGREYVVEYAEDVTAKAWKMLATDPVIGDGQDAIVADREAMAAPSRFYRIQERAEPLLE